LDKSGWICGVNADALGADCAVECRQTTYHVHRPSTAMLMSVTATQTHATPTVTELRVVPVAGRDSMLLNLSGAHGPFFTRNIVILRDSAGNTGVGEVPGGEKIRQTLDDARPFVVGQSIGNLQAI